jgi:hypothetical protein
VGSGDCDYETGEIGWLERPLKGNDFNSSSPAWIGNQPPTEPFPQPMWSEELFVQHGAQVTQEGLVTRYVIPNED